MVAILAHASAVRIYHPRVLAGAIPAALLALLADGAIGLLQRLIQRPRR